MARLPGKGRAPPELYRPIQIPPLVPLKRVPKEFVKTTAISMLSPTEASGNCWPFVRNIAWASKKPDDVEFGSARRKSLGAMVVPVLVPEMEFLVEAIS